MTLVDANRYHFVMALEIKQSLRMAQQLVITPQLQQAIRLLQLSRMELATLIQKELCENPCLEELDEESETVRIEKEQQSNGEQLESAKTEDKGHDHLVDEIGNKNGTLEEPKNFDWENYVGSYNSAGSAGGGGESTFDSDDLPSYDQTLHRNATLQEHLFWQLGMTPLSDEEIQIGEEIIGNINDDGYLRVGLGEIADNLGTSADSVEKVLQLVQAFDPLGVGSRDLRECLLMQCQNLEGEDGKWVTQILRQQMEDLEKHDFKKIAKALGVSVDRVLELEKTIHQLDPKPGRAYSSEQPQYITPDVFVYKRNGEYVVVLNEDGMPKLNISPLYRRAIMSGGEDVGTKTKDYIQDKLRQALWLIKSIHQRQQTLFKVTTSIVKFQKEFFDKGTEHLKPMILKDVAEDIGMHESTVSRVTTNKYVHTPRGLFELKYFFNSALGASNGDLGVASEVVKNHIQSLIGRESPQKPLSDQEIMQILKDQHGVDMARRTVAKYREVLKILPSSRRRRKI